MTDTTRTNRTPPTTSWTGRPSFLIRVDYLYGNNGWVSAIVQDENGDSISIYADSGYEQVDNGTERTARQSI